LVDCVQSTSEEAGEPEVYAVVLVHDVEEAASARAGYALDAG
jgi:hypothetical protein